MYLIALAAISIPSPTNITVYHVNPHQYGAVPINMDTGDAVGDMFFDLFEVIINPLACPNGSASPSSMGHVCTNPEAVAPDLMVNKLTLEVDMQYSGYAKCNIGDVNGTDGRGHPCKTDTYCCFCGNKTTVSCNDTLGRESLYDHFGGGGSSPSHSCREGSPPADCYRGNAAKKLSEADPGYWYSSLAQGYCGQLFGAGAECTWRVVSVDKIVTRQCHSTVFGNVVQATGDPACLDSCGDQRTNTSSPCWTDCFYQAALGPESGIPGGKVEGMLLDDLKAAWVKPFLTEEQGGCPPQTELSSWYKSARQPSSAAVDKS